MENKIRFRGYVKFEDSLKVQKVLEGRKLVSPSVVITVATLVITAFIIYKMQTGIIIAVFLLLFMVAFMYAGLRFMKTSAKKTQEKIYQKACTKRTGVLTNDGITIRKKKITTNIPWKLFEKAIETENIITIKKDKETLSFARYMFENDEDWTQAKNMIKRKYSRPR
jgi:c-di-AMP phosphodiesterase-like protein